jgi:hypothetical protein
MSKTVLIAAVAGVVGGLAGLVLAKRVSFIGRLVG